MKDNIIYYIIVHSPLIIDHFEDIKKYESLKNYKYLLVGTHDQDYSNDKIIQCDRLEHNIEQYNNFLVYTAWWALIHNSLIPSECDYVGLFEYDLDIMNPNMASKIGNSLSKTNYEIFGTKSLHTSQWYIEDHGDFFKFMDYSIPDTFWMATFNLIFRKDRLEKFIKDPMLDKVFKYLDNSKACGHKLERYTTIYTHLNNIPYGFIPSECFSHNRLDSHSTQERHHIYESFINRIKQKNLTA